MDNQIFNRPLTPHLTIYTGQYTSIYSILHRITALSLIFILILYYNFLKFSLYSIYGFIWCDSLWVMNAIYLNLIIFFCYHMFNGIRHIIWDLGYMLKTNKILISAKILGFSLLSYAIILILKLTL